MVVVLRILVVVLVEWLLLVAFLVVFVLVALLVVLVRVGSCMNDFSSSDSSIGVVSSIFSSSVSRCVGSVDK